MKRLCLGFGLEKSGSGGGASSPFFAPDAPMEVIYEWPFTSDFNNTTGTSTETFSRLTSAAEQDVAGLWLERGDQVPRFSFRGGSRRYKSETGAISATGFPGLDIRDLTQAAWVKTNCTAAKNQTGIAVGDTGTSASSLTATAADATCLLATVNGGARTFSAYIKRLTGSGTISITRNGGTTWTDVTAQVGATFAQVSLTSTVANSSFGFKLTTSGDAIAVDMAQDENRDAATSPLNFRGYRESDNLTITGLSVANGERYMLEAEVAMTGAALNSGIFLSNGGAQIAQMTYNSGGIAGATFAPTAQCFIGPSTTTVPLATIGAVYKTAIEWGYKQAVLWRDDARVGKDFENLTDPTGLTQIRVTGEIEIRNLKLLRRDVVHNIVMLGDSITESAVMRAAMRSNFGGQFVIANKGQAGNTIQAATARVTADVTGFYQANATTNTVIVFVGTNSLAANVTAANAIIDLQACVDAITAGNAGWRIVLITTLPDRSAGFSGGANRASFAAAAATYNTAQKDGTITGTTRTVDAASLLQFADATDTTWILDGIHPTTAGYEVLADYIHAELQ